MCSLGMVAWACKDIARSLSLGSDQQIFTEVEHQRGAVLSQVQPQLLALAAGLRDGAPLQRLLQVPWRDAVDDLCLTHRSWGKDTACRCRAPQTLAERYHVPCVQRAALTVIVGHDRLQYLQACAMLLRQRPAHGSKDLNVRRCARVWPHMCRHSTAPTTSHRAASTSGSSGIFDSPGLRVDHVRSKATRL